MITRPAPLFLCLCACAALVVQSGWAQTTDAADATPPPSPAETDQVNLLLSSCVQLIYQNKISEAGQKAEQALALSQKTGNLSQQVKSINIIAFVRGRFGQTPEAIRLYQQAAAIAAQANDRNNQAVGLLRAGSLLRVSGLYAEALDCLDRAIALYRQEKNFRGEVLALEALTSVYTEVGDFDKARQQLQLAAPLVASLNDKVLDESLFLKQGMVEKESGNNELALKFGLQALVLDEAHDFEATKREVRRAFEQTLDAPLLTFAITRQELLLHLGTVYGALENHQKAAEFLERAMELAEIRSRPLLTAVILGNVAGTQLKLGKPAAARDLAIKAITMLRASGGSKHWDSIFLYYLAEANRLLGLNDEALISYRQAIAAVEQARSRSIPTEVSRAGIVTARHEVFAGAIDFFLSQRRDEEALETAEAWHARAFLDILTESRIDLRKDLSSAQREQEDKIFVLISRIQKELWTAGLSPAREQELKAELATAENALESFQLEVRRTNPLYASIKYPQLVKPAIIARELLGADTALIEYVLGARRSFAWVVYRGKISSFVLPPKKEIEVLITGYRGALAERASALTASQSINRLNVQSRQIYQQLLQPMEDQLKGARTLIIVPDGVLSYLPFETLVAADSADNKAAEAPRYLLETFAISYAPSASALAAVRGTKKQTESKGFVAFGDPIYPGATAADERISGSRAYYAERGLDLRRLPYARTEVTNIGEFFPAAERRLFLGAEANEGRVKAEKLDGYRYVHFAAHGMVDEENPARSGVVLSFDGKETDDGTLQVTEIMRLKLNADLVTLSACRTGMGKVVHGEGVLGLTRAFQYAGANSVVVSLWNVNDIATAELMQDFYQNLKRGLAKDEALRQAKLQLLKGKHPTWQHPYFWAPFVLVGANN